MIFSKVAGGINGVARNANVVIVPVNRDGGMTHLHSAYLAIEHDVVSRKLQGKAVLTICWCV